MARNLTADELERLEAVFAHHPPTPDKIERHARVRKACKASARALLEVCPRSRETSKAITALQEAMFWANAAIAREQPGF